MNKRNRKKQLQRAAPYAPGGGLMYVPVGQQTGVLGQTFYGSSTKNIPVGQSALFSPGVPLPPQPNVDPLGRPVQFRYPISWNTFAVDRSLGHPDIPSFEQLRRLAKMYSGITLNERYWLDLVPRMTLDIRLKKKYVDQGAEPQNYQKEIATLKTFWEKPDGRHDTHTWMRMCLREQSQIDELYWYKNRTRRRKLLGLWVVAGDQMKPLLDDWGMLPDPPDYAYQQYPWGIPGMRYSTAQMVHYQETPAADSPFGFSRVERFILEVNQALRKKRKDMAHFTEGNIPQSFMEVPESLNWTPDQIDAYEQSWNALLAGNQHQQVRVKFMQPGMKYTEAEQYPLVTDFDLFLFKIACGCYGVPVTEFGFTEDSNRSSGESQEDMVYRRTIGPIALSYAALMTDVHTTDFPDIHGEMFEAYFGGYEEIEDEQKKASAITLFTGAGILGLTDAAKMANLPIDPKAPKIGRMMMTQSGPIWLDDIASPEMRKAQQEATMAGYQLAAHPPDPAISENNPPKSGNDRADAEKSPGKMGTRPESKDAMSRVNEVLTSIDEQLRLLRAVNVTPEATMVSQQGTCDCEICRGNHGNVVEGEPPYHDGCDCTMVPKGELHSVTRALPHNEDEARSSETPGRAVESVARAGAQREDHTDDEPGPDRARAISQEFRRWRERAIADVKANRTQRPFESTLIADDMRTYLSGELARCACADDVRAVFERARERDTSPKAIASDSGGNPHPIKSGWKLRW